MNRVLILLASLLVAGCPQQSYRTGPVYKWCASADGYWKVGGGTGYPATVSYCKTRFSGTLVNTESHARDLFYKRAAETSAALAPKLIWCVDLKKRTYFSTSASGCGDPHSFRKFDSKEEAEQFLGISEIPTPTPTPTPEPDDDKIVAATSGTGFFVSPSGHVITNHHVIEDCKAVKVSFKGNEVDANVLAVDRYNDLAILKTALNPNKVFPVSAEDAALLDDVVIAGFPLGKDVSSAIKTSKGSVTSLAGYGDNYSEFQTDAALNQGNSGGPIMNQKGNVIGVAVSAYGKEEYVESFNFGIKASTLKTFAQSNSLTFLPPNNRDLSNSELGQLITDATLYLECWMTVAQIKKLIAQEENRKVFFSEFE